ncbi:transposase [Candidatus Gottesmanbacteria bacterium]|nr:transposase [Candidatus Gottesmanbacteria bacterium]
MPYRKIVFANNEVYHIVNRGVADSPIFVSPKEYQRFLNLIDFYHFADLTTNFSHYMTLELKTRELFRQKMKNPLVEILAYCLMPNHFHLLLKQIKDNGISKMLANLQNGYVRYFNLRHNRHGPLFQSMFKAVRIETDEQLLHVSRYIHLNPTTSYLVKSENLLSYPWSSLAEYLHERKPIFTNPSLVLALAGGKKSYKNFVYDQIEYQRELNKIKHLTLENS